MLRRRPCRRCSRCVLLLPFLLPLWSRGPLRGVGDIRRARGVWLAEPTWGRRPCHGLEGWFLTTRWSPWWRPLLLRRHPSRLLISSRLPALVRAASGLPSEFGGHSVRRDCGSSGGAAAPPPLGRTGANPSLLSRGGARWAGSSPAAWVAGVGGLLEWVGPKGGVVRGSVGDPMAGPEGLFLCLGVGPVRPLAWLAPPLGSCPSSSQSTAPVFPSVPPTSPCVPHLTPCSSRPRSLPVPMAREADDGPASQAPRDRPGRTPLFGGSSSLPCC